MLVRHLLSGCIGRPLVYGTLGTEAEYIAEDSYVVRNGFMLPTAS
jgi:hypothetical protein